MEPVTERTGFERSDRSRPLHSSWLLLFMGSLRSNKRGPILLLVNEDASLVSRPRDAVVKAVHAKCWFVLSGYTPLHGTIRNWSVLLRQCYCHDRNCFATTCCIDRRCQFNKMRSSSNGDSLTLNRFKTVRIRLRHFNKLVTII